MIGSPLTRVARSSKRVASARQQLYVDVVDAVKRGCPVSDVARAAGLTRQAIYNIMKRAETAGNEQPHD